MFAKIGLGMSYFFHYALIQTDVLMQTNKLTFSMWGEKEDVNSLELGN